jgi:hypothetical protein
MGRSESNNKTGKEIFGQFLNLPVAKKKSRICEKRGVGRPPDWIN